MQNRDEIKTMSDKILHDKIMKESEYLEELLGPVTYEDPEDFDLDESFQQLLKDREALKAEYENNETMESEKVSEIELKKITRKKRIYKIAKAAILVLTVGTCVVGFGLKSEATRMWWMNSINKVIGNDSSTRVNNDSLRQITELPEEEAMALIEEDLQIEVPQLLYKPAQMEYSDSQYDTITKTAIICYKNDEVYLTVQIVSGTDDKSMGFNIDGEVYKQAMIKTSFGEVSVKTVKAEGDEKATAVAEWDYEDMHYQIFGKIDYEEMKQVVENIYL